MMAVRRQKWQRGRRLWLRGFGRYDLQISHTQDGQGVVKIRGVESLCDQKQIPLAARHFNCGVVFWRQSADGRNGHLSVDVDKAAGRLWASVRAGQGAVDELRQSMTDQRFAFSFARSPSIAA